MLSAVAEWFAPPKPNAVTSGQMWTVIKGCNDAGTLAAWAEFGRLLLAEVQARTAALDAKATAITGWSVATAAGTLALLPRDWRAYGVLALAVLAAMVSSWAARVGAAYVPSQADWLAVDHCVDTLRLQRYHLLSMRDWHEHDGALNRRKAALLVVAQALLGVATVALLGLLVPTS